VEIAFSFDASAWDSPPPDLRWST